jgi:citrate lyase synthetase
MAIMECKCIICDKIFITEKEYKTNHYVCSFECITLYDGIIVLFDGYKNKFVIDIDKLNKIRKEIFKIDCIDLKESEKRIN